MKKREAICYFGTIAELARSIGRCRRTIEMWGENVPKCRVQLVKKAMRSRADRLEAEAKLLRDKAGQDA